jgi:sec-independent protein translocase protein TatB
MFDIGFAELMVVGIMGLVVLGPEKLPTAARTVGLWVGRIRRSLGSIQREISAELKVEELKRTASVSKEQLDEELKEMSQPFARPFGEDSPAQKSAMDAPKSEFDPAAFTSDPSVKEAYAASADATSGIGDEASVQEQPSAAKVASNTESSESKRDV